MQRGGLWLVLGALALAATLGSVELLQRHRYALRLEGLQKAIDDYHSKVGKVSARDFDYLLSTGRTIPGQGSFDVRELPRSPQAPRRRSWNVYVDFINRKLEWVRADFTLTLDQNRTLLLQSPRVVLSSKGYQHEFLVATLDEMLKDQRIDYDLESP
jgi:hypothetical protein